MEEQALRNCNYCSHSEVATDGRYIQDWIRPCRCNLYVHSHCLARELMQIDTMNPLCQEFQCGICHSFFALSEKRPRLAKLVQHFHFRYIRWFMKIAIVFTLQIHSLLHICCSIQGDPKVTYSPPLLLDECMFSNLMLWHLF